MFRPFSFVLLAALLVSLSTGCGGGSGNPPPETFPVAGKVQHADGSPFEGGMISLVSTTPSNVTMSGEVSDDGSFEINTIFESQKLSGGVPGTYSATVTPLIANGPMEIYKSTEEYEITAGDNNLTVTVRK